MEYNCVYYQDIHANVNFSIFKAQNGKDEIHAIVNLEPNYDDFLSQLEAVNKAEEYLLDDQRLNGANVVCKRFFLSDAYNQTRFIDKEQNCAVSCIQQPPLNGTKVGLWIYLVKNVNVKKIGNTLVVQHNGYEELWNMGMQAAEGDSFKQTDTLLRQYEQTLELFDANIADNCIRTWFYVRDVDIQYMPMVVARRENFLRNGLSKDSHFIASTGICGVPDNPKAIIQLGAYAIKGIKKEQVKYIQALTHLNPTYQYGVTFERCTKLEFGDRKHVIISGTASINNKGEVLHVGDVRKQTIRMWENVEALLKEAGTDFNHVMHIIVYLRDTADYQTVKDMFENKFPHTPKILTLAPVCRPEWLIEMECIAVKTEKNDLFKDF